MKSEERTELIDRIDELSTAVHVLMLERDELKKELDRIKGIRIDQIMEITDRYMGQTGNSDLCASRILALINEKKEM